MKQFLTDKSIFFSWQTLFLFLGYIGFRVFSYVLIDQLAIQAIVVFLLLMLFGYLYYKNPDWAWLMLLTELFLGGSGHFIEFFGLSVRSVLLIAFIILWTGHTISNKKHHKHLHIPHFLFYLLLIFGAYIGISMLIGSYNQHPWHQIAQDIVPFTFFFLLFPLYHLFEQEKTKEYLIRLLTVFIIGSAVFSLYTFILFSSGAEFIHGDYYGWFRDVLGGKITDMFTGFFRIVAPEHLLIVPATLLLGSLLMRKEQHHILWRILLGLCLLVITLNFSRTYFLALAIGFIVLLFKHKFVQWLVITVSSAAITVVLFSGIHFIASQGDSAGWELFGLRVASITQPELEASAHTRSALLSPILQQISQQPILGSGLGEAVLFTHPITLAPITTTQFDWGYLELLAEIGIIGTGLFLALIISVFILLIKKIRQASDYHDFYVGLLAGLSAFAIMTITTPAFFHVFGIFFLTLTLALVLKPDSILHNITTLLYRTFHKNS